MQRGFSPGPDPRWTEQIQFLAVIPELHAAFQGQSYLLEYGDGTQIVDGSDSDDSLDAQRVAAVQEYRRRRFRSIALGPVLLEKGEADIGIDQRVALNQAAHAYGCPIPKQ